MKSNNQPREDGKSEREKLSECGIDIEDWEDKQLRGCSLHGEVAHRREDGGWACILCTNPGLSG